MLMLTSLLLRFVCLDFYALQSRRDLVTLHSLAVGRPGA
jgi:hypothetical protein